MRIAMLLLQGIAPWWQACAAPQPQADTEAPAHAAQAQYSQADLPAARDSFERSIRETELGAGALSMQLLDPLTGLAHTLVAMRQLEAALDPLRRAVQIVRRSAGLYDVRQYALLEQLVDIQSELGHLDEALADLKYMERVSKSSHGSRSLQHAEAMSRIGTWYCRMGRFFEGRERHRRAIAHLERRRAADSLFVDALMALAHCSLHELAAHGVATAPGVLEEFRGPMLKRERMRPDNPAFRDHVGRMLRSEGDVALRRAVQVADAAALDSMRRAQILLQTADWFQAKDQKNTARIYYRRAAELLVQSGPDDAFATPVLILYPVPPSVLRYRDLDHPDGTERFVEVDLLVRADGRVGSERVVDRDARKSAADETLSAIKVARFRPRLLAGEAVATRRVKFRQRFWE